MFAHKISLKGYIFLCPMKKEFFLMLQDDYARDIFCIFKHIMSDVDAKNYFKYLASKICFLCIFYGRYCVMYKFLWPCTPT
jgi:hypothetical protein